MPKYELPNGKYIDVEEGFVGSQEEKDFLDNFNRRQQTQSQQPIQSNPENIPAGKENNWLYDTAIVAPLEGGRKFINSTGRLIEDLGDTLGEATGIELTGSSKKREFEGFKGFFYDPSRPDNDDHTTSMVGSFVESGVQFLLGYGVAGKVLSKVGGAITPVTTAQKIAQTTTQGAIGDFIAFDETSGRFADVVTEFAPDFGNTFLSYLQTNKNDTWYEGRLKNSLEGVGLGLMAEVLFKVAKRAKNNSTSKPDDVLDNTKTKDDNLIPIYHSTNKKFDDFDLDESGGMVWFSSNKKLVEENKVGASSQGIIVKRYIDESKLKLADRKLDDQLMEQQLINQGYDGVKYTDTGQDEAVYKIFKPEKLLKEKDFSKLSDDQIIANSQEAIRAVKPLLDEAKTTGDKMKIINQALENVDGLRPTPKNISQENKTAFLTKLAKQDLEINYDKWKAGELSAEEAFAIPRAWINFDTLNKEVVTKDFVKNQLSIIDLVKSTYKQVDKKFTEEAVNQRRITEYGGDFSKMYKDHAILSGTFRDIDASAVIGEYSLYLRSLVDDIPRLAREVKLGTATTKDIDNRLAILAKMQNDKKFLSSEIAGSLLTNKYNKDNFVKGEVLEKKIRQALDEFESFGASDPKSKQLLIDKLAIVDNPTFTSKILSYALTNKFWDIANEVWINALLSNPKTLMVNAVSNAITAIARPLEDYMGSKASAWIDGDNLAKKAIYENQIKESKSTFLGLFTYLREATKYTGVALRTSDTVLDNIVKTDTATTKATGTGLIGNIIRTPTRILNATDEAFKQINYRAKLSSLAVQNADARGLKGKEFEDFVNEYIRQGFDEKGLRATNSEALKYAQENTFTNELTGFSKKFQDAINTYPVFKQFFPFVRTPFQLAKAIADRSFGTITYNLEHLLGKSGDPKMIAKVRGQFAMGGILLGSATALYQLGMISGSTNYKGDGKSLDKYSDAELLRFKKSETNFKPYAFKIGEQQFQFGRLDPYGAFFGLIADFFTIKDKLTADEIDRIGADFNLFLQGKVPNPISYADRFGIGLNAGFNAVQNNLLNKTYFQAIQEMVDALFEQDANKLSKYINNKFGSSVIPNIVTKINNDPYLRDAQGIIDEVFRKRLGLGTPPSPRYNFLGEPHKVSDEGDIQRFFNNFINPTAIGKQTKDPVAMEILRLGKAPTTLTKFQDGVDYTEYKFGKNTAYDRLNQLLSTTTIEGLTLKQKLAQEIKSESYLNGDDPIKMSQSVANDGSKYTRIKNIYEKYKTKSELEFLKERDNYLNVDDERRTLSGDIKKMKNNDAVISQSPRPMGRLQPIINFYEQKLR